MAAEVYRFNPVAMMLASPTGGYNAHADYDLLARELAAWKDAVELCVGRDTRQHVYDRVAELMKEGESG